MSDNSKVGRGARTACGITVRQRCDVSTATGADHLVLMDARAKHFFGLDEIGARIWQLLEVPATAAQVAEQLAMEYDAPLERISADSERLFGELLRARLVEEVDLK
jgi:Coenzyme PQQ synthesis protein D (PqqD)